MAYLMKVVMFGDGANGAASQIYEIVYREEDGTEITTGITKTWQRTHRDDPGTITYKSPDKVAYSFQDAVALVTEWAQANGKEPPK